MGISFVTITPPCWKHCVEMEEGCLLPSTTTLRIRSRVVCFMLTEKSALTLPAAIGDRPRLGQVG